MPKDWSCDVPISMPEAPDQVNDPVVVIFGNTGFGMTQHAVVHTITQAQVEEAKYPIALPVVADLDALPRSRPELAAPERPASSAQGPDVGTN